VIVCGDLVSAKKPAPDVYLATLSGLALAPRQALAIEDSSNGVRSARAAGLPVITTPSLYSADDDFSPSDVILCDARGIPALIGW
jgi:beta-phosphoglucomutase-like phosphatase (HAD superfamily)